VANESLDFLPLLVVIGLAALVPLVLARFRRIPVVVGEIVAGIIIGRSGLGLVHEEFTLQLLAEIGFAFLMFLSGLEIDFSLILNPSPKRKEKGPSPLVLASLSIVATLGLAVLVGFQIVRNDLAGDPWIMALILSTTSLGIVVPVLKERGLSVARFGQAVLLGALLADFLTMLLITNYVALRSSGLTLEITLVGVLFLAFLVTYRLGIRQVRRPAVKQFIDQLSGATSQFKVRVALALMMAFVVLAETVNVELILGAFLAGAVVSLLSPPEDESIREKLEAIGYGFFIPVFFIMVGVEFDLPALLSNESALLLTPLLLLAAFGIKLLGGLVYRLSFNWRKTLATGALLSARLSLIIAASAIGLRLGVISEATNAAIILVAICTSLLAPTAFNWILPAEEMEMQRRFVIYGAANIGLQVAKELEAHGECVCFIEPEERLVKLVRKEGYTVIHGEGTVECLEKVDVPNVEALLVLSGEDDRNLQVSKTAAAMGVERIVALVHEPTRVSEFKSQGIQTFAPAMFRATLLALMARNPQMVSLLTSTTDGRDIREVSMQNPVLAGKALGELVLPGDSLILAISRSGEVLIPHGGVRVTIGDKLIILGENDALRDVKILMEGRA